MLTQARLKEILDYDPATGAFTWRVSRGGPARVGAAAGSFDARGYRVIEIDGQAHKVHRLAWFYMLGVWPNDEIDHINRERADNRWCNLREADRSQNMANAVHHQPSSLGRGVTRHGRGFQARISSGGRRIVLGTFGTQGEAATDYLGATRKLHGEFARSPVEKELTRINRATAALTTGI